MKVIELRKWRPVADRRVPRYLVPSIRLLSTLIGATMKAWRAFPVRTHTLGIPVLSVGSISAGGTGKTPLTIRIVEELLKRGRKLCVVLRGYKRQCRISPLVVSDGEGPRVDVGEAGDEAYLIARRVPEACVVVDANRFRAARIARDDLGADVVVLDDGFQSREIQKVADIVTVTEAMLRGEDHLIPFGSLRESPSALSHADAIVVISNQGNDTKCTTKTAKPIFTARYCSPEIVDGTTGTTVERLKFDDPVLLVSGIARPTGFEALCMAMGLQAEVSIRFDDHHWYSVEDVNMIRSTMQKNRCESIMTTEKDFYKLARISTENLYFVRVELKVEPETDFIAWIEKQFRSRQW